jgi:hexosaminidase
VPTDLAPTLATEAYRVEVSARRITVTALDVRGLLRGLATLEQLARRKGTEGLSIAPVVVVDHPRFAWRGLCIDLARHYIDVDTVKAVVTVMYTLKLNVLHLHLTDDQGWRLHVPSRPRLSEVSGRTSVGGDPGGYLTVEEYHELTTFAAALGVTVVPEFDIPGHVNAALHAYGDLAPSGNPAPAYTGVGVGFSRLDGQLPATAQFIRAVFGDLAAMTPGPYVHIGGDEALTMHAAEYDQLVALAAETVRDAGKTVIAWQEAARSALPAGSVLQFWDADDVDALVAAAAQGARVVLSPAARMYLDMRYDEATPVGQDWAGHITLQDAYAWEPCDALPVSPEQVLGVEAAIWTETVRTSHELFILLLPRLAAVADVAWSSPERRDWNTFCDRLPRLTARWQAMGLSWYRPALDAVRD